MRIFLVILVSFFFQFQVHGKNASQSEIDYAIRICQNDMQQFKASGLSTKKYLKFCECYMKGAMSAFDEKELKYQSKYKKPSGKFQKISKNLKKKCENR